jgi:single-strand DNA-binding protein
MSTTNFAFINIQGRLTDDPEVGQTNGGTTYCKFRVAVNRRVGKDEEKTSFIPVIVYGTDAVNCGEYLSKGRVVTVTGEFRSDKYEDRDGNKRTGFEVVASKVIFGSGGRSNEDTTNGGGSSSYGKGRAKDYLDRNRGNNYGRNR